jgi:hypothetical protein
LWWWWCVVILVLFSWLFSLLCRTITIRDADSASPEVCLAHEDDDDDDDDDHLNTRFDQRYQSVWLLYPNVRFQFFLNGIPKFVERIDQVPFNRSCNMMYSL